MRTLKFITILIFLSVVVVACGKREFSNAKIMQEVITLHNLNDIAQKIRAETSMTKEEIELFANGIIRLAPMQDSLVGKTVLDVIKSQKSFVRGNTLAFSETTAARVDLALNHKFHYVGIQPRDNTEQSEDVLVYEITNTSDKEIKKVQGGLQFYTQDNQLIKIFNMTFEKNLAPGEKHTMGNRFLHDKNNERDKIIRNSTNLKAVWSPTLIEFADGTIKQLSGE